MSMHGEEIINRLHQNTVLLNPTHPMRKIILGTIGEWLDNHDDFSLYDGVFLDSASGGYLDLWGKDYGVPRRIDESDDDYRKRLYYEVLGYLTVPYLLNVYGLPLFVYVSSFDASDNDLTSDNPYIPGAKMSVASDDVQSILSKKFVIGTDLTFLEVDD